MEPVKKDQPKAEEPETVEQSNYVFITFPQGADDDEAKRLLKKLEGFFPKFEFVFGNSQIWAQEVKHILNVNSVMELDNVTKDKVNKDRARNAALNARECLEKWLGLGKSLPTDAVRTHYFYYWELKQALRECGNFPKITNKETKELITFLELFHYINKYRVENKDRYCLIITKDDEADFLRTNIFALDDKIKRLNSQKEDLTITANSLEMEIEAEGTKANEDVHPETEVPKQAEEKPAE